MAILTPSVCSHRLVCVVVLTSLALVLSCHREVAPSLHNALTQRGTSALRAQAFTQVGLKGKEDERGRAWFLAGLFAADAGDTAQAAGAFARANLTGWKARLAARRLEESFTTTPTADQMLNAISSATWALPEEIRSLQLRCAEVLAGREDFSGASGVLPNLEGLQGNDLRRALAVEARIAVDQMDVKKRVLLDFPQDFSVLFSGQKRDDILNAFSSQESARLAQGWLNAGQLQEALKAANRAGSAGLLVGARAASALRRPSQALAFASRLSDGSVEGWVERAEAYRQLAWNAPVGQRRPSFASMLHAIDGAFKRQGKGNPATLPRMHLLRGEALVELGRFSEAASELVGEATANQPRWDWVVRRWYSLQGRKGAFTTSPLQGGGGGARLRRIAAFWEALADVRGGRKTAIENLAESKLPDLPMLWARGQVKRTGVTLQFSDQPFTFPPPPRWAEDLMSAGRVADVIVAWRLEVENNRGTSTDWLGLMALAQLPPLEAIPLLIKGEPRLLAGPWEGLPRPLMEAYLPLPLRSEIETASRRTGVPPWILAGLVRQESAWKERAVSGAGAVGLAQLIPAVAKEIAPRLGIRVASDGDLLDPGKNLTIGAALLADWRRAFGGTWTAALASYNAGERRIREIWDRTGRRDGPEFVEAIEIPQTLDYVHRVVLFAEGYRMLYWPEGKPYPWT